MAAVHAPVLDDGRLAFARFLKPRLMELLRAISLDVVYERAEGDTLAYRDEQGRLVEVLDLLGGYGASLLGHNHPALVARAREVLERKLPFNAQASARGQAGLLARRLAEKVGAITGREYVVTLANSGAEVVEAAIKHAEIEMAQRITRINEGLKRTRRELRQRMRHHASPAQEKLLRQAARAFDVPRIDDLDEVFIRIFNHNLETLFREPQFLAIESAFHGKSTGSLKLTNNPVYRHPWRRIGLRSAFLPHGDVAAVKREVSSCEVPYFDVDLSKDGDLDLVERRFVNVSACFAEPIQGEGGIRELAPEYLRALREVADAGGFPLVFDEIQCGLGRTGTFLASEAAGVRGDYYLFSKALGGGLSKVGALLVDRERYEPEYGWLHTSTFADDDFSSACALEALEVIEREDVLGRCRETGARLRERLEALRARWPDELVDVRGRGLMLGIELGRAVRSPAPLIRVLSEQNLLGFFASGWLLHEARVRVAPTLSAHATIRLEPSAFVAEPELARFLAALDGLLETIHQGDSYRLARYLVGRAGEPDPRPAPAAGVSRAPAAFARPDYAPARFARKVAFLGHFLEPADLRDWDPALAPLSDDDCQRFLERTQGVLEPFLVERKDLRSLSGDLVNVSVIGLPFTAAQAVFAIRTGDKAWILEQVEQALGLAKQLGCTVAGFGGYISIVTDNCQAVAEDELALTSGNSLAAVAGLEALALAADRMQLAPGRLGILGAAGNIGAVLAEVAADRWDDLLLVGRPGATRRLELAAGEVYFGAWKRLTRLQAKDGLAGRIADTETVRGLLRASEGVERVGEALRAGLAQELGERAPVRVSTEMAALRETNLIVTATNAARPILLPEHLGPGPIAISDVAAPRDVDPRVQRERPDVLVLRGGLVKAPLGQTFPVPGMRLPPGQLYGCLAETVLLGLSGSGESFSFGKLVASQLRRIRELARAHGFEVEEQPAST